MLGLIWSVLVANASLNTIGEDDGYVLVAHSGQGDVVDGLLEHFLTSWVVVKLNGSDADVTFALSKFRACVVLTNAPADLQMFFDAFFRTPSWNSYAKFFLIASDRALLDYFAMAFKYFVLDFVVVTSEGSFGYYPYENGLCGNYSRVREVGDAKTRHRFVGFNKCAVNVATINYPPYVINRNAIGDEYPGLDIIILREIAKRSDFTINYVKHGHPFWGHKRLDGVYTGMYSMLMNGQADLMVGLVITNETYLTDVEAINGYIEDYGGFFVPVAKPIEAWKNLTLVFSVLIWALIIISIVTVSVVLWIGGKFSGSSENRSFANWSFKAVCILLNSFNAKPKSRFSKTVLFMWSVYSLLIVSTYQGRLISFLTQPAYEHQISTVEEMVNAPQMSYGGFSMVRTIFHEPTNAAFMKIYNNWTYCSISAECLNRTAFIGDFGVMKSTRQVTYLIPKLYTDSNGRSLIHPLPPLTKYLISFTFTKGFPIFHRVEQIMARLRESGLIDKWDNQHKSASRPAASGEAIVLTLDHLKMAFLILGFGSLIASFVFTIENALARIQKTNPRLNFKLKSRLTESNKSRFSPTVPG